MSFLYVGVGGTGGKLMHSLVHLAAAGVLPEGGRDLMGFLVDPDQSNGSVSECIQVARLYKRCQELSFGKDRGLFRNGVILRGPWSPVTEKDVASLDTFFDYDRERRRDSTDADLMDLLFSQQDRGMQIMQGFRGRPSIGAAVFGRTLDFDLPFWRELRERALGTRAHGKVPLLMAGSVFGGSGAAGVPTICRRLKEELGEEVARLRLGLILMLPYFDYGEVPGEKPRADHNTFATATAEALEYYAERQYLDISKSIYAVGERFPARMPVAADGAKDQRNPPHFVELVAALGAVHFFRGSGTDEGTLLLAGRRDENTVTWADLPSPKNMHAEQMSKLQQFTLFATAFYFEQHTHLMDNLHKRGSPILEHLGDTPPDQAGRDFDAVRDYVQSFLAWMLNISTPRREDKGDWVPGLVDVDVFAVKDGGEWRLKTAKEFNRKQFSALFRNLPDKKKPDSGSIFRAATAYNQVTDPEARGAGKVIRAIYDACKLF